MRGEAQRRPALMMALLKEIRHNPLLWLLAFVPVVFLAGEARPEAHTLLFVLSSSPSCHWPAVHESASSIS
jgi:hypothetical protein